jgi:hypothetical protein
VQDVDARLWQDPFVTVAETLAKSPELTPKNCGKHYEGTEGHCRPPSSKNGTTSLIVLVASVSGAPYSEEQETRRRTRYAVLAALNTEGYVPQDSEHIGFYWPEAAASSQPGAPPSQLALEVGLAVASTGPTAALPKVVPFEWFNFQSDPQSKRILGHETADREPLESGQGTAECKASRQDQKRRHRPRQYRTVFGHTSSSRALSRTPILSAACKIMRARNANWPQLSTTLRDMADMDRHLSS